jgi:uncharacterized protein YcfL
MKKLLLLVMAVVLVGCAAIFDEAESHSAAKTPIMESWIGKTQSELIMVNGAPSRIITDGKGGKILVWEESNEGRLLRYTNFWADSEGVIYHWKWEDFFTGGGATRGIEPQDP